MALRAAIDGWPTTGDIAAAVLMAHRHSLVQLQACPSPPHLQQ